MSRKRDLRRLERAARQRDYLFGISDVLGYGVGFREQDGDRTSEPALIVYVRKGRKAKDPKDFPRHQRIPRRVRLEIDGETVWLPVDIVEEEVGELCAATPAAAAAALTPGHTLFNCENEANWGTLGWVARRQDDQTAVLCGSYHVLMRKATGFPVRKVVQEYDRDPANPECVESPDVVGETDAGDGSAAGPIGEVDRGRRDRRVDVAVVPPVDSIALRDILRFIGRMGPARYLRAQEIEPGAGEEVRVAASRAQGPRGRILEYPAFFPFRYPDWPDGLRMTDLIATDAPVRAGDSGALLVDTDRRPLGMLIGGGAGRSFFMHMRYVVDTMGLEDMTSQA